ncbi:MAG: GNAT family protein [Alphaproteobacteria bacterium]|nr:GNAT family protein [Alphaproteobacteria bacterium]
MAKQDLTMRPACGADILPYAGFLADPEVTVWLDDTAQVPISSARVEAILLREAWCLWALEHEGRFIGVTSLYEPDLARGCARFSVVIGEREAWGKGLGSIATRNVAAHAFENLGLRKIISDYLEPNIASKKIHQRAGFVVEGRLREDAWRQGRWVDRIVLSLLAGEWRDSRK